MGCALEKEHRDLPASFYRSETVIYSIQQLDTMKTHLIQLAYMEASRSPDPSTQVGAVVAAHWETRLGIGTLALSAGHNHFPQGVPEEYWHDREKKYAHVIHAEASAILRLLGGHQLASPPMMHSKVLYGTWACCKQCALTIIESGVIEKLVVDRAPLDLNSSWRDQILESYDLLEANGIAVEMIYYDGPRYGIRFGGKVWEDGCQSTLQSS